VPAEPSHHVGVQAHGELLLHWPIERITDSVFPEALFEWRNVRKIDFGIWPLREMGQLALRAGVIGLSASVLRTSFVITVSLLSGGSTGRDEADYFILAFFSNSMGREQQGHVSSEAERLPAQFPRFAATVLLEQGVWIFKTCIASSKVTPCFRWLVRAFAGSHSNRIIPAPV